jgi:NADH dehydrogenase [ubiquinone] 1 alpha subcomplex assembly factor 6
MSVAKGALTRQGPGIYLSKSAPIRCTLQQQQQQSLSTRSSDDQRNQSAGQVIKDHQYCVDLVRERDREGYLCGLLMPPGATKAYFAIRAFNVELASVKDSHNLRRREQPGQQESSSSVALQMRMQWWRDALKEIYEDEMSVAADPILRNLSVSCWHNPVVRALSQAHQQCDLTRRFLERLIDARDYDLNVAQYSSMNEAATYAEDTISSLLYLSLECTGTRDDNADEVASYAGVGIGLTTALRATPFRLMHGEIPIPKDLLRPAFPYQELMKQTEEEYTLIESDAIAFREAVRHMANAASTSLARARDIQGHVPRHARACLLPVVPSIHFLSKLEGVDYHLFDPKLNDDTRLRLMLLMGRTWLTGIF